MPKTFTYFGYVLTLRWLAGDNERFCVCGMWTEHHIIQ